MKLFGIVNVSLYVSDLATKQKKKTPWRLVREQTIPTDRPPLVD
jgi:hypothetical protein